MFLTNSIRSMIVFALQRRAHWQKINRIVELCSSPFSEHIQKDILDCTLNTRAQFECFTSYVQIQIRFDEQHCVSVSCRDGNGSILMGRVIMGSSGQRHNLPSHFLLSPPPSEYRIRARTPGHCALRVLLLEVGRARAELALGTTLGRSGFSCYNATSLLPATCRGGNSGQKYTDH